ncbi:MAG: DUF1320 family protein [Rhodocyclaceae bacterium]|nr:DUF1320 family protein [Rhodocyclaceae bacterium]
MYGSVAEMVAAFGAATIQDLTDRADPPAGAIDEALVLAALQRASDLADGYLSGRYAVPLAAPLPAQLIACVLDVARYYLYVCAPTEQARQAFEDARAWLRDVQLGRVGLPGVAPIAPAAGGGSAQFQSGGTAFGRGKF